MEAAVVESTAVAEDGGVRSVEVDDEDRIVWVAPLPDNLRAGALPAEDEPVGRDRPATGGNARDG